MVAVDPAQAVLLGGPVDPAGMSTMVIGLFTAVTTGLVLLLLKRKSRQGEDD